MRIALLFALFVITTHAFHLNNVLTRGRLATRGTRVSMVDQGTLTVRGDEGLLDTARMEKVNQPTT